MRQRRRRRLLATGIALALAGSAGTGGDPTSAAHVAGPTVSVTVPLDRPGPPPEDLEITFDGSPRAALAVERAGAWTVLVYIDVPLSSPTSLDRALELLAERAEDLARLGQVEIAVADPLPQTLLEPSRDAVEIRDAFDRLASEPILAGEQAWLRRRFEAAQPATGGDSASAREAIRQEQELLAQQTSGLLGWLDARGGDGPRALVLLQDAVDLDPRAYYLGRIGESFPGTASDLGRRAEVVRAIAAAGWTAIGLALAEPDPELVRPREPLRELARASGGQLVTRPKGLDRAVASLASALRVSFEFDVEEPDRPRALEVSPRRPGGGRLRAPAWVAAATPRRMAEAGASREAEERDRLAALVAGVEATAIRLVRPRGVPATGRVRLETVTGDDTIDRVAFFLDGELAGVADRPPFRLEVDLGPEPRPRLVRAEALSAAGRLIGDDTLLLNGEGRSLKVEITGVGGDPAAGSVQVEAEVTLPAGAVLDSVDFFWNRTLGASVEVPPFRVRIPSEPRRQGDLVRVVARLADGRSFEAARLVEAAEVADRVSVNLVRFYAFVTDRSGKPRRDLRREDFRLRVAGRERAIEQFEPADHLPLALGLTVDTSGSMQRWMERVRQAAVRFLETTLRPQDRVFVVDFDDRPRLAQSSTGDFEMLLRRLVGIRSSGNTALYDAVLFSLLQFQEIDGRGALVVVTDGLDSGSRFRPDRCARHARLLGVPVYLLVVGGLPGGDGAPEKMLSAQIVQGTGGRLFWISSAADLERVYEEIDAELRSQYLLAWSTDRALTDRELRKVKIEVADRRLSVRAFPASSVTR